MRESISYEKNFLNNTIKTNKKNKEESNIRGITTIQLFDLDGNIIQENRDENLFNEQTIESLFNNGIIDSVRCYRDNTVPNPKLFDYIYLTNDLEEENKNRYFLQGDIIGYAGIYDTYSGNSKTRGTVIYNNKQQAFFNLYDNSYKLSFEFDFPSHSANGDISKVYFASGNMEDIEKMKFEPLYCNLKLDEELKSVIKSSEYSLSMVEGENFYFLTSGESDDSNRNCTDLYVIYKKDNSLIKKINLNVKGVILFPYKASDDLVYGIKARSNKLYKIDIKNASFEILEIKDIKDVRQVFVDDGEVFVCCTDYYNVFKLNNDLTENLKDFNSFTLTGNIMSSKNYEKIIKVFPLNINNKKKYLLSYNGCIYFKNNISDKDEKLKEISFSGNSIFYIKMINNKIFIISHCDDRVNWGYLYPFITTENKLSNIITKTEANTMKIKYDIIIKP